MQAKGRKRASRLALASAGALALAAAGCGSDDEESASKPSSPTTIKVELSGSEKKPKVTVPATAKGGLVTIEVTNNAKGSHGAQLIQAEGHPTEEAIKIGNAWGQDGKPLPSWVKIVGGVGSVDPGKTGSVTQQLPAGDYIVFDTDTNSNAPLKVSGGEGAGEPSAPATITAREYNFKATGLKAGKQKVLFDNQGKEPHFIAAAKLKPGGTIDEVRKAFQQEKGEPPVEQDEGFDTAVIDGGTKQTINVDLKSGKYALLCFVPDRKGGPPHVIKGMASEAVVE